MGPALNIPYWNHQYDVYFGDDSVYWAALGEPDLVERARKLWKWKSLNRTTNYSDVEEAIGDINFSSLVTLDQQEAVLGCRDQLRENGVLSKNSMSLVTPAFLLHLADSSPDRPSARFPIYDVNAWNGYVYLWRKRSDDDVLYAAASTSPREYASYCRTLNDTLPPDTNPREYEKALFMLGMYATGLLGNQDGCDTLGDVRDSLRELEEKIGATEQLAERV